MKYGAFWFMNRTLGKDLRMFQDNLIHIQQEINRSKEDFIQEHFKQYEEPICPPVWKTLEVVSFGTLSKLYCNFSDNSVKKHIAAELKLPQHIYLESWIKCSLVLRNCIAHHTRIWNKKFPLKPQLPKNLDGNWIDKTKTDPAKLYAQLCCLSYLQNSIHPQNNFKNQLKKLLTQHPNVDVTAMGFPKDWTNEPLWK